MPSPSFSSAGVRSISVHPNSGSQTRLATWVALPGHTATPAGSISTPVNQIAAVQVHLADNGQVMMQRSV
jgi:hypothetical protein